MLIEQNNNLYIKASKREQLFWENDYFGTQSDGKVIPEIQEYENFHKTGDKNITYLDYIRSLGKFHNGLSIGGGFGEGELAIVSGGIVEQMTFVDFSDGSNIILMQNAKKLNIEDNVHIINGDLNFLQFSENSYDFIICRNVLHHIINLEECLYNLNRSLTSNGIIVIDEFIGANRFQWSQERIDFVRDFQKKLTQEANIKFNEFQKTNARSLINNCPFEAIRSQELYDLIQYYFGSSIIRENKYGYLFEDQSSYIQMYNSVVHSELLKFEEKAESEGLFPAPRLFGVYQKGNKELLKTKKWSQEEVKRMISILPFSELGLMRFGSQCKKLFPGVYSVMKRLYFFIRK